MCNSFKQYKNLLILYLKPQWLRVTLLTVLLFTTITLSLINPQILGAFVNTATSSTANPNDLLITALIFLVVVMASQILTIFMTYISENISWNATNKLRADLVRHSLQLDMPFHSVHTSGEMIERIDGDVAVLSNFFSQFVIQIVGTILLLLGILTLVIAEEWRIGGAIAIYTILATLLTTFVQSLATRFFKAARQASAELSSFLSERLASLEDIRACNSEKFVLGKLDNLMQNLLRIGRKSKVIEWLGYSTTILALNIGIAIVIGLSAAFYYGNSLTLGAVYVIVRYTQLLLENVQIISTQLDDFQRARAAFQRISELLQTSSNITDKGGLLLNDDAPYVEFENVTFGYESDKLTLTNLSFKLESGQILGVVGRTGSGKTTLSRLLLRFYDPQAGTIRVGGKALKDLSLAQIRHKIGVVTQEAQLFRGTVRDNLTFYDKSITDEQILQAIEALSLNNWLKTLPDGLNTVIGTLSSGLSAGEAQLLVFIRVLLKNPSLIILDEASARLDPVTERFIKDATVLLLKNRTGIIIAHRLSTLELVDQIMILENGAIYEQATRQELASNPASRYATLLKTANNSTDPLLADRYTPTELLDTPVVATNQAELIEKTSSIADSTPESVKAKKVSFLASLSISWKLITGLNPKLYIVNCLIFALPGQVSLVALGLVTKAYFDGLNKSEGLGSWLLIVLGLLMGINLLRIILLLFDTYFMQTFSYASMRVLRGNLFSSILKRPGACPPPYTTGETISRLGADAEKIGENIVLLNYFVANTLLAICIIVVMGLINWLVTLIVCMPMLATLLITNFIKKRVRLYHLDSRTAASAVSSFIGEIFSVVQSVQISNQIENIVVHFEHLNVLRKYSALKESVLDKCREAFSQNTNNLAIAVMLLVVSSLLKSGSFSVGDFALFTFLLPWLAFYVWWLGRIVNEYNQLSVSCERLLDIIEDKPAKTLVEPLVASWKTPIVAEEELLLRQAPPLSSLTIKSLSYTYQGSGRGINTISFEIKKGSFVVITGKVGAGKTTLLRTILGLLPKNTGSIYWNGREVTKPDIFFVSPQCAYVPQIPQLYSDSLKENILFGLPENKVDFARAIRLAVLEADIKDFPNGSATLVGSKGVRLSGGQIQRVAAARMFIREPDLLVMDDLGSALDSETEATLWGNICALDNTTCLVVSHHPEVLKRADHIIILKDGEVTASGTLVELQKNFKELQTLSSDYKKS